MQTNTLRAIALGIGILGSASSLFGVGPQIDPSTVHFAAEGPKAVITYTLSGAPAIVTMEIQTNTLDHGAGEWVDIGGENVQHVKGDVNRLIRDVGTVRTIEWKAHKDIPNRKIGEGRIRAVLTAWATNAPPDWLVMGLTQEDDVRFYASTNYLPQGFSSDLYKTDCILMRRIPARGVVWMSGADPASSDYEKYESTVYSGIEQRHLVMLSKDYYMGVYTVTQGQWKKFLTNMSEFKSDKRPVENVKYGDIRGYKAIDASNNLNDADIWPAVGYKVPSGCFLDLLRKWTGLSVIDLPTAAQWEFACRGGAAEDSKMQDLAVAGWFSGNRKQTDGPNEVGLKAPNGYQLFDMRGNVQECVQDRFSYGEDYLKTFAPGWRQGAVTIDPVGASVFSQPRCFLKLGGCYKEGYKPARASSRAPGGWAYGDDFIGFRLWCPAEFN